MKCECGNDEFYACKDITLNVIVDGYNNWKEDLDPENNFGDPYGPYICTKCGKEYYDLEE